MSVDKFGRHSERKSALQGPQGEGFSLTNEGHYDMGRKRLKFVEDPQEDTDAANKRYVDSNIPLKRLKSYSFQQFSIKDVAYPSDDDDAVNLAYLKDKCLTFDQKKVDVKGNSLINVKEPINGSDAATKIYVDKKTPSSTKSYWAFSNRRLAGVSDPKDSNDAVTLQYFDNHTPKKVQGSWGFGNKRLVNVAAPQESSDAVNVEFLTNNSLCTNSTLSDGVIRQDVNYFDAKGNTISNVGKPMNLEDVVNRRYLKELLAEFSYAMYLKAYSQESPTSRSLPRTPLLLQDWKSGLADHNYYNDDSWKVWYAVLNK